MNSDQEKMENKKLVTECRKLQESNFTIWNKKIVICLIVWYFFSFTTLFLNKYIVSYEKGDPTVLGSFQLLMCAICGYFHLKVPLGFLSSKKSNEVRQVVKLSNFTRALIIVGSLRFSTLVLGLVALWYVPVSFAETVKSSAPVFTVVISRILLGEKTSLIVNMSLIPVMMGLALCSAYELSFTMVGFVASLATNISECLQNVCSKRLLTVERYEVSHIQFYTSASSFIIQIPCLLYLVDFSKLYDTMTHDTNLVISIILNGVSFHIQSISEYVLLSQISPVTHSVANTGKRAFLIWLSILFFGNPITTLSWIGTATVIFGVLIYNKARNLSSNNNSSCDDVKHTHDWNFANKNSKEYS
ncbi:Solute carrier family 35 member E2-like protein [Leptotrombidium deliense]|uniref:Solute carrier family 35 member E2-like protein n=1 Tax=Leptotrombidium deliense TaxID=299467 RepID=A0A443SJT8_9ACAR|nr:Solute carrier family 35 member E2-like protein [Leptotrombidium deliense]